MPVFLHLLAILSLAAGIVCAGWIAIDEVVRPQKMAIMNLVWPLAALFGSIVTLAVYWRYGRISTLSGHGREQPFPILVAKAASHCGSGCALGDFIAEWLAFIFPAVAVWIGWTHWFSEKTFSVWILDYVLAFIFGIAFQYFTIKPMRQLSFAQGMKAALRADFLSLTSWQIGMYGAMAIIQFGIARPVLGQILPVNSAEFWFAMQIAMIAGFMTSFPVNWWLLKMGIKEKM